MRILITGGYGFIGSYIAARFSKEGHDIHIIDNLATGYPENVSCRHKFHKMDVTDADCEPLFKNSKFDIVIHLAARIDETKSIDNTYGEAKTNILGLVKMLSLSSKYKVPKFIFASSSLVYGTPSTRCVNEGDRCEPLSPFAISKMQGEIYCEKWSKIYQLDVVCLRFSNVYGPRQGRVRKNDLVSRLIQKMVSDQKLVIQGEGEQCYDFIYVEDVAEAVYRVSESSISGVYNISSNTLHSINQVVDILHEIDLLQGLDAVQSIVHEKYNTEDVYNYSLSNAKIQKALNWFPVYTFVEGISLTYQWYRNNEKASIHQQKQSKSKALADFLKPAFPFMENLLLFFIVLLLEKYIPQDSFIHFFDLKIVYIILLGLFHGMRHSLIAFLLSTLLVILEAMNLGRDFYAVLIDSSVMTQILSYGLIGIAVGYTSDKKNKLIVSEKLAYQSLEEKFDFLQEIYDETYTVKCELQNQITTAENGFGKIYSMVKTLNSVEVEYIYMAAVDVLKEALKTDEISIYTISSPDNFLRLSAKSNYTDLNVPHSMMLDAYPEVSTTLKADEIFVNKAMQGDLPLIIAPIFGRDRLIAAVFVHKTDFEVLTLSYLNLLKVVTSLIRVAMERAYQYEEMILNERYINDTKILNYEYFNKTLYIKSKAKLEKKCDFSLIKIVSPITDLNSASQKIQSCLRGTDAIGMNKQGDLVILMDNTTSQGLVLVTNRLKDMGIAVEMVEGEINNV